METNSHLIKTFNIDLRFDEDTRRVLVGETTSTNERIVNIH